MEEARSEGLLGEDGQRAGGGSLADHRADVPVEPFDDVSFMEGFLQTDEMFDLWAEACADTLAQIEADESIWSWTGTTVAASEGWAGLCEADMQAYVRLAFEARALGPSVDAARVLASQALHESDALRLMLVEQGLGRLEDGRLVLDEVRVQDDLGAVVGGFALSGQGFDRREGEQEMAGRPGLMLGELDACVGDVNKVISDLRAEAAARTAQESQEVLDGIEKFIADCAAVTKMAASLLTLYLGGSKLAAGVVPVGSRAEHLGGVATDIVDPDDAVQGGLESVFAEQIAVLEGRVDAFQKLEGAQAKAGRMEAAVAAAKRMQVVAQELGGWGTRRQALADDYSGGLGNLGAEADERLRDRGLLSSKEAVVGPAATRRASMVSTRLALASVLGPLRERQGAVGQAGQNVRAVVEPHCSHHRLNILRQEAASAAGFYGSVEGALGQVLADVLARHDELAAVGDTFFPGA